MGKLMNQAVSLELLLGKADYLKERNFKPGFDNMSADGAKTWLQINGPHLQRELLSGNYQPQPASGFYHGKKDGGYRLLTKLTAIDTLLQYAILDVIQPICETVFDDSSFGYRPGRGAAAALNRYCYLGQHFRLAAKLDPVGCFDHIDRTVLEYALSEILDDKKLCSLIMQFAEMPVISEGQLIRREAGILQGAPLSPILCNIYFHALDCFLREKDVPFIRYADDLVIFSNSATELNQLTEQVRSFEHDRLHLELNRSKCCINSPVSMKFLGYRFHTDRQGIIAMEADTSLKDAYHAWHAGTLFNTRGRVNILSDGILRQKDYALLFEADAKKTEIPAVTTGIINIYSSVIMDSGFLSRAASSGITVNVFDKTGHLTGRFLPNKPLRAPSLIHEQLMLYYDAHQRAEMAARIVLASIHNSVLNLRYYKKTAPDPVYDQALRALKTLTAKIRQCGDLEELMLLEARAREIYYGCYDTMLKRPDFCFEKRTRRPPGNAFNAMLSFGNTVLYNVVAEAINKTPLDIRVGILHATSHRMESLNLDLAELFKPLIVDRVILALVNRRAITPEHFVTEENGGVYLSTEGKHIFLRAFYEKLDTSVTVKGGSISYERIITEEPRKLVRALRDRETYEPFRQIR